MQHRGPVAVVPAGGGHHAPRPSGPINHAPRPNGPTKTTSNTTTTITKTNVTPSSPNMDSTLSLVKQLVTHFVEASFGQCRVRDRDQEEAFKGRLKVLVYSILLSHRKDYARENSSLRLNELEEVIWHTHVLRQQRRFDDGNALDGCLHALRERGHLEAGSDVRTVMRFLVALKGQGGAVGEVQQPVLAELRPRIVHQKENTPSFLPPGPLQYGDTFLQKAETGRPYLSFPSSLYTRLATHLPQDGGGSMGMSSAPFDVEEMIRLSSAPPGTGVSPLLTGESDALKRGKVLGALLQESRKEVSPNMALSLPRLPNNAKGYNPFSLSSSLTTKASTTTTLHSTSPSGTSGVGGDEGYASSHSNASHSTEEEGEEDPWETVLAALPLSTHRSWATLGHIPETKEKPFISEAGTETTHNVWLLYQELWSIVGGHSIPQLCVRPVKELCQDILYLLIGVPSNSFLWSDEEECFSIKSGLCHPNITPEALKGSLLPLVECGTLVRRLEVLCSTPKFDTQQVLTQGSVFIAFTFAISNMLQTYREKVLNLGDETLLSGLLDKAQPLVKKIKFVASLCKITTNSKRTKESQNVSRDTAGINRIKETTDISLGISNKRQLGKVEEGPACLPRGLCLLGDLLNSITTTKDRDCLLLLISIFKSSCMPFFRYLEEWIYQGVCSDPGAEFMIEVSGAALLRRDRMYWTSGYTLRPHTSVPSLFRDVLEEAFVCGKTINLLRVCSAKHYLVSGSNDQPAMQLCVSGDELAHMQSRCEVYAAHMDHVAAQMQVTVQRKAEEERLQKHRLMTVSTNKHAAVLKEIESKMHERNQHVKEQKAAKFKELKEEMEKAEQRKQEQKDKEAKEDCNIAQEQEEMERRKIEKENALRIQMEQFYQRKIREAEQAEARAKWKVQRWSLNAARKHCIENTSWDPAEADDTAPKTTEEEEVSYSFPQTPDSIPEEPSPLEQEQGPIGGALKRPHHMYTQGQHRAKGCTFAPYHLQPERNEELLKESPNQEVSSVSDMTASLMSTSSDFVDTPFDENLPEFEADPKIQTIPESCAVENTNYAYMKSSIEAALYDNGNGNLNLSPPGATTSPITAPPVMLTASPDANANVPEPVTIIEAHTQKEDHQGNKTDHTSNTVTQIEDHQGNTTDQSVTQTQDYQGNTTTDDSNSNLNELVLQFKERRAQAAAIKEKVLNEYHQTTTKNNMNIIKSRAVTSSSAAKNKQRVVETEYGMTDTEAQQEAFGGAKSYSRQVSSTSTSSFLSCSSSERPMSTSTAFTTPDEERPILIDQVGGEVLKERGRSIHGHASDAVIHKLLWKNEPTPLPSPNIPKTEVTPIKDLVEEALKNLPVQKTPYYDLEFMKLMDQEPLLDITGSALRGRPNTRPSSTKASTASESSSSTTLASTSTALTFSTSSPFNPTDAPSTLELSCVPVYFIRSIRMHLATQSRLVNESLLAEVLVQRSLLDHFTALRSLLLLHDAHFARALTTNLFGKLEPTTCPATLLVPTRLNNILNKSVADSCWSTNPLAENLSFVVTSIPPTFTHTTSIVDCLELRYRVSWPHNLILDNNNLTSYSRVWSFLASLHHAIWASDNLFCHTAFLSRQDKEGLLSRSSQFHQLCLHRHKMHHFLQALHAYVISQIHQISWSRLEEKLQSKVTSLDHLYTLHSSFIEAIISRCFLSQKGQVVQRLIKEVFSCTLRFCSQFLAHPFVLEELEGGRQTMVHPAFAALKDTFQEFESHAAFLHKSLLAGHVEKPQEAMCW
ncbi:gamma-tubulin complex component 6-like isoform X10 [Eriocheir sinensis]|uniref:gamma-tubulin complex component 6-like isoform X10 n=1 Tax=Eriocheir sinensis TaxID=95602 RepID=UPI0021C99AD4|nr:gamma-tubulin complex component 6-like isoform X10 [Eriocheir sinensis]